MSNQQITDDHSLESRLVNRVESEYDVDVVTDRTLFDYLLDNVDEHGTETTLRWKHRGIWKEYTWNKHFERIQKFALGIEATGFGRDDVLFTIGMNRPQQLWAWYGVQLLGGVPAPNYEEMLPEDIAVQLNLMDARAVLAEDQELVDKVLTIADEVPTLETIIYREHRERHDYESAPVTITTYESIVETGADRLAEESEYVESLAENVDPSDLASLAPTSGTTGAPKRVKLTHTNFINLSVAFLTVDDLPPASDYFSYLPMAWIGEQIQLMGFCPIQRWVINFPETEETVMEDLREIGPEFIVGSPSMYEDHVANVTAQIENTSQLKESVYRKSMTVGNRLASYISGDNSSEQPSGLLRLAHRLFYWISYRPIADKMGLKRAKKIYTGGAPLGEQHFQFYHALSLNLKQGWGTAESSGYITIHHDGDIDADTMGKVLPNVEVGELPNGELVVRGPTVTEGYYNQPDKTAEALEDGWIHTDDFGQIRDDGHVQVFDRLDDVIEMSNGRTVAPKSVETRLKFNPFIQEAMVIGDDRPSLTAMLTIRYDNVSEWADQRDIQYTGYSDLATHPAVLNLLADIITETNQELDTPIERFLSLFKEFDPDDGEITQTQKLRREPIKDRYSACIEALYAGVETVEVTVPITYSDGRQEMQTETVPIRTVEDDE